MTFARFAVLALAATIAAQANVARANDTPPTTSAEERDTPAVDPEAVEHEEPARKDDDDTQVVRGEDVSPKTRDSGPKDWIDVGSGTPAPLGKEKTGVSSQTISVPKGTGKIDGMGESFSMELSTGIGTFSIPIAAPPARGAGDASLQLSYSTSRGPGVAGMGWNLPVAYIARETDRGLPRYDDPAVGGPWHEGQDRFVFGAGQELVPICLVTGQAPALQCEGEDVLPGEQMPAWSSGWQYFRARVEGAFLRFFWSPDHATWVVQAKSGVVLELGTPLDGSGYTGALERDPGNTRTFRWNIVRQYDAQRELEPPQGQQPRPVNLIQYRYKHSGGMAYLEDVFYTPPATGAATAEHEDYAHHLRLEYESRPDVTSSYRRGWLTQSLQRLKRVDVTSKPMSGSGNRQLTRRVHLAYNEIAQVPFILHVSLLTSVTIEGRCVDGNGEFAHEYEDTYGTHVLPNTSCPTLPKMTFSYERVAPYTINNVPTTPDLPGFEGFDDRVQQILDSPKHSLDGNTTDLFDVDGNALPDVLVTLPGLFQNKHGLFFLGAGSGNVMLGYGGQSKIGVDGVLGADAGVIALSNPNVAPLDADGDGIVDLLHMPKVKTYSMYDPRHVNGGWWWVGREVVTAAAQSPKIDFQQDADRTRVMDVNGDGLVDVVFSSATEMQTFFNLGYRPNSDGQFGHVDWSAQNGPAISNDAATACKPWSATPVGFDDPDVVIADMNGDGLPDIVRVRKGDVRYWPGRGNGFWGTGALDDCTAGSFAVDRHIVMTDGPIFSQLDAPPRLDDMNGDGLDDLVQIRFNAVDIWLNVDGVGWTPDRHIIQGTPAVSPVENRVRLVDVNGSGSRDILWGDGYGFQYIDPLGGARPWVLQRIENGLGKSSTIEYQTSTQQMLAASPAWSKVMPTVAHVVAKVTERDHLDEVGLAAGEYVTEYTYRDPVYEGRQREFRGFSSVRARVVGDAYSPTSITETTFLLGECKDETADAVEDCSPSERWRDNPREALKGMPVLTETWAEQGAKYLNTAHTTVRLRHLYDGLDGRVVRHAFARVNETYLYDVAAPTWVATSQVHNEVELELDPFDPDSIDEDDTTRNVVRRATDGRVMTRGSAVVDVFGNSPRSLSEGCVEGCGSGDPLIRSEALFDRPANDTTGWLWRTVESYVAACLPPQTPSDPDCPESSYRNRVLTEYDAFGNPLTITAKLSGSIELDRFHEDDADVADAPTDASIDGDILVAEHVYDELGNAIETSGPNGRCRGVQPDTQYAELPVIESIYRSGCGNDALQTSADYDRGLGLPIHVLDLHLEPTDIKYDSFGRLWKLFRPDPVQFDQTSPEPSVIVDYLLTDDPESKPFSRIWTRAHDGISVSDSSYHESWSFIDGMGRVIVSLGEADPNAGDDEPWIVSGRVDYTTKGQAFRTCLPGFTDADPAAADDAPIAAPADNCAKQQFDAFGRVILRWALGEQQEALNVEYHALSEDAWDGEDLATGGPHYGTYASSKRDGHGRTVITTERVWEGNDLKAREIQTEYLPTGEPTVITRVRVDAEDPPVMRWLRYDSLGRRVLNVDPHTTTNFSDDVNFDISLPTTMHAWRYAYNDAGDLVGTSDARGCGANYHYDAVGRIVAEDYSPCLGTHQEYSEPNFGAKTGIETLYHYDSADPGAPTGFTDGTLLLGRLASVSDRASHTITRFDGRGRVTAVTRRIAKPGVPDNALANRYAPSWYTRYAKFDGADRSIQESTGATDSDLMGVEVDDLGDGDQIPLPARATTVETTYSARGTVKSVGGSYLSLINGVTRAADGLVTTIVYGSVSVPANVQPPQTPPDPTPAATTTFGYDSRRRLASVVTDRTPPWVWSTTSGYTPAPDPNGTPSTFQTVLQHETFAYDLVDNPRLILDGRDPDEWPAGAKPVDREIFYDNLYRVAQVDYTYDAADDTWVSPFAHENDNAQLDPRLARPSPHVSFDKRILTQSFEYDWLGNTSVTDDDADGFYDRSLGEITNDSNGGKPYQLKAAAHATGARKGSLDATYDDAGNLTSLVVLREGPCLPAGACSQRFRYDWDEVGRLVDSRRWDFDYQDTVPDDEDPDYAARLVHAYDAGDQRVIKSAYPPSGNGAASHTLYVFPSLELRRAEWLSGPADYDRDELTEVPYLFANGVRLARVVYEDTSKDVPTYAEPPATPPKLHVLLELGDHLGSTSVVVDKSTGELVERSGFQAYGAAESGYRPDRWKGFREDYRFTGKEEDVELGLQYFGFRFYAPALGRWVSADPLTVHGLGADLNVYAYVRGAALKATDPLGLNCELGAGGGCPSSTDGQEGAGQGANPPEPQPEYPAAGDTSCDRRIGSCLHDPGAAEAARLASIDRPLETPPLDPIDFAPSPGSVGKLGVAVGKWSLKKAAAWGAREGAEKALVKAGGAGVQLVGKEAAQLAGKEAAEVAGKEAVEKLATSEPKLAKAADEALAGAAPEPPPVLLDSNAVPQLPRDPTLGGRLAPDEQAVVSYITAPELRDVVARGGGLRGVPRVLATLPVLTRRPSLDTIINVRGQLNRISGRVGDGIIGAQTIDFGIPLITNDRELGAVVRALGGTVR